MKKRRKNICNHDDSSWCDESCYSTKKRKKASNRLVEINQDDRDFLYICAERYCMGRRTYAVNWCCDLLTKHLSEMRDNTLKVFLDDMEFFTRRGGSLGDICDLNDWERFKAAVLKEQARRPKPLW